MVGVAGFEPAASWTRTKRDTKLRHTPIDPYIIMTIPRIVKGSGEYFQNLSIDLYGVRVWDTESYMGRIWKGQTPRGNRTCALDS